MTRRSEDILERASTLVELLRLRAERDPGRRAYLFLEDGEREGPHLDYGGLDLAARSVGAALQEIGVEGAPVLLLYPPGLDFVSAFFGCLYGGAVAIPAPAADAAQLRRTLPRLASIAKDARPRAILTTAANVDAVRELLADLGLATDLPVIASDALAPETAEGWKELACDGDTLAFLQYTSGSTADPKGVMITHANLLYTAADIDYSWRYDADSVCVSWLPIFHDMGLICGVVLPVYRGFPCVLMSPLAFVQRPFRWLRAVSEYRATHSAAPNFAYELAVKKVTPEERESLDLSAWRVTLSSAEPVRAETMQRFAACFAASGFRWETFCPGFGLAESTVKVTASPVGVAPVTRAIESEALERGEVVDTDPALVSGRGRRRAQWAVGNGPAVLETRLRIVDPESTATLPADRVGEIWVQSPSVARGYWERPDATRETFEGRTAEGEGPFLRTGDLGFLDAAGELFVTGRLKDLLILHGRNVYPQDVEATAEAATPGVRAGCSASFSVDWRDEERLVVVVEMDPRGGRDPQQAAAAVAAKISEQYLIEPLAVLVAPPHSVPKTSSGKVQRRLAKERVTSCAVPAACVLLASSGAARGSGAFARKLRESDPRTREQRLESWMQAALGADLEGGVESAPLRERGYDLERALEWRDLVEEDLGVALDGAEWTSPDLTWQGLRSALVAGLEGPAPENEAPPTAAGPGDGAGLLSWMRAEISRLRGMPEAEVDVDQNFAHYGLDSLQAVELASKLEGHLGRKISSTLVWDHPTLRRAAEYLVQAEPRRTEERPAPRALDDEPIAIVGVGCRFPGASGALEFWELLCEGRDAITEVPSDRWDNDAVYHERAGTTGKLSTRFGGFVRDVDLFDAAFFGISNREAARMDPQQRLLLEVCWEALEDAGLSPDALRGSRTGVFVGIGNVDYARFQLSRLEAVDAYAATGNAYSIAAGRLSYAFDWRGPAMAIDTACSSSLVALHQATRSLREGECDTAVAGGVNLILSPEWTVAFSHAQMMAGDGRCKTFDAAADGYVRGEGCGLVVLKRLSDALRDRDDVLAVVRGSAVNQDGHSNGITAPNGASQEDVMRRALAAAGVEPRDVSYIEAHGTGTPLGDPIEVAALARVYGGREAKESCVIGSVKTNIGHLEAAAGVAGLIKAALVLRHGEIPAHLHLKKLNPHIDIDESRFSIPTERRPWPVGGALRRAAVSSFGFGGTNAHVVLEEAPGRVLDPPEEGRRFERPSQVVCLSARSVRELREVASRLDEHLAHEAPALADVAFTLNTGRRALPERAVLTAGTLDELRSGLQRLAADESDAPARGRAPSEPTLPRICVVFTGQGSQRPGMARELYETQPVFRAALERCAEVFDELLERPLLEVLFAAEDDRTVHRTAYTQPALFAVEWALWEWWRTLGVQASAFVGHSIGEFVAATAAGALELEDACRLVGRRGQWMGALSEDGAMAAVLADRDDVEALCRGLEDRVSIAAHNAPRNVVVSGERAAVSALVEQFRQRGVRCVELEVSHAFHSPLVEPMLSDLEWFGRTLAARAPDVPVLSNRSGAPLGVPDGRYWRDHARGTVEFDGCVRGALELGCEVFLEVGPEPALSGSVARIAAAVGKPAVVLPSLRAGRGDWESLYGTLGELFVRGIPLDWEALDRDYPRCRVSLPTYPFERERHWIRLPAGSDRGREADRVSSLGAGDDRGGVLGDVVALFRQQNEALLRIARALDGGGDPELLAQLGRMARGTESDVEAAAPAADEAPATGGAVTPESVAGQLYHWVSRISGTPVERLRGDQNLHAHLGFDSLMTVELDRRLRGAFPGLGNAEEMFTENTTLSQLRDLIIGRLEMHGDMELMTEFQRTAAQYATYAEMIGKDPSETYVGGAFKDETHTLHDLHVEPKRISGRMDVSNKYSGTAGFHLTQMGAYSFLVQLIHGWLCYRHGVGKDGLGMPKLSRIHMTWSGLVRTSSDIPATVEIRDVKEADGVYTLSVGFEIAGGAVHGELVGFIPISTAPRPESECTPATYGTYAELIGMDPSRTYTGGTFKDEVQTIHDLRAEGTELTARLDVANQYSGTPAFHLTQMGTYSYLVQLMLGYFCYKHGVRKDDLGMPTLKDFLIEWDEMVTDSKDVFARIQEKSCVVENGRYRVEFAFEVGDGNGSGRLTGLIPIPKG